MSFKELQKMLLITETRANFSNFAFLNCFVNHELCKHHSEFTKNSYAFSEYQYTMKNNLNQ